MPRGYVIMSEVIRNPDGMAAHGAMTYDSLVEHGAKMLVVDADYEVREGTWEAGSRIAIMEFESPDVARQWYESEAGQAAHTLRKAAADCNVIIASGFVPKNPANLLAVDASSRADEQRRPLRPSGGPSATATTPGALTSQALGVAPGRSRMVGRRVVVVGAGQTDFQLDDQPIGNGRAWPSSSAARGLMSSSWTVTKRLRTKRLNSSGPKAAARTPSWPMSQSQRASSR